MALDPTGIAQWAVKNTLDRVIKYVGEANKYWDHCQELEKYLDRIKPMIRGANQSLDQNSHSSTSSRPFEDAPADKCLRDLEPLLREAETVLKGALDWAGQCDSFRRRLAITTKKKWADKIRAVTQDIQKVCQFEIPIATHAKVVDLEKTITMVFSTMMSRGLPIDALAVQMNQLESKMLEDVQQGVMEVLGRESENAVEILKVVEACIKNHVKEIRKAVLKEEQAQQKKAELEAALKRLERIASHGVVDQFQVEEETSAVACVEQEGHYQAQVVDAGSKRVAALVAFSRRELKAATNNFTSCIGEGSFGEVYFGALRDGRRIAVKVARDLEGESYSARLAFVRELEAMSKCRHQNILMLLGYCISSSNWRKKAWWKNLRRKEQQGRLSTIRDDITSADELLLVTEFAENGTVRNCLLEDAPNSLNWGERFQIIVGTAMGLDYLSQGTGQQIVHRDIKPGNIFLDEHKCPKIGDFGLSKFYGDDLTDNCTKVMGTLGFLDFEDLRKNTANTSVDVYGFGITVLCIVSGRTAIFLGGDSVPGGRACTAFVLGLGDDETRRRNC